MNRKDTACLPAHTAVRNKLVMQTAERFRRNDGMGRDDENEASVGWALPTVFPVFMRLCWWAEPTLLNTCWNDGV